MPVPTIDHTYPTIICLSERFRSSSQFYDVSFVKADGALRPKHLKEDITHFYCPQFMTDRLPFHTIGHELRSSQSKAYVLVTHAVDGEQGLMSWVLAKLLHPSPRKYWDSWKQLGFKGCWNTVDGYDVFDLSSHIISSLEKDFGITEEDTRQLVIVRKLGSLVTDNVKEMTRFDSIRMSTDVLMGVPVVFW
ncbi:hypothetical protein BDZ91DRAFT_798400 [Kalaharituber pfeilii]|nr:hypothetical protein BDZ91DRAFT_798400 [Kalaharituber pfeilii]